MTVAIQPVYPGTSGWSDFVQTLGEAGLPVSDLEVPSQRFFTFAEQDRIDGYGGYAVAGSDVLLRSIAVRTDARGRGLGKAIVELLVQEARKNGSRSAWLLTTDSEAFFARVGFTPADRKDAPPAIAVTPQFAGICPGSAHFMHRPLESDA